MKKTLRWLVGNLGLILLSLALAVMVWAVAVEEENPTRERRYPSAIPVTIPELPEGMIAYGQIDVQVYVTLRAPESVWSSLQPQNIHATVDLTGLEAGTHQVPIQVVVDQTPVRVQRVEPAAATISLEPMLQVTVPVSVQVEGATALGYIGRVPVVDPSTVTVSGPTSLVTRVVAALTRVSLDGERADVEGEFDLEPVGADGGAVPDVVVSPTHVTVRLPVEQLSGFRDLALRAVLAGQVAPGYRISSVTVEPPVVTVFGSPETIAEIPGYLETAPLILDGAQTDVEVRLPLVAPEGVSLLMQEPVVTVQVLVVPLEGSLTLQRPVEIQGLAPGITATVAPQSVEVILSGPLPVLEELAEEDVRVIVDLFELSPGIHSVEPRVVVVPTDVLEESVLPATVQVEIAGSLTPSPGR
jgi:YbbR domain-containing protein